MHHLCADVNPTDEPTGNQLEETTSVRKPPPLLPCHRIQAIVDNAQKTLESAG